MHKYEVYVLSDLLENAMPKSGVQKRQVPVHAGETLGPGLLLQILKDIELDRSDLVVK